MFRQIILHLPMAKADYFKRNASCISLELGFQDFWHISYGHRVMIFSQHSGPAGSESCLLFLPSHIMN